METKPRVIGNCECGQPIIYEGKGRPPTRCVACRSTAARRKRKEAAMKAKRASPEVALREKVAALEGEMSITKELLGKANDHIARLKGDRNRLEDSLSHERVRKISLKDDIQELKHKLRQATKKVKTALGATATVRCPKCGWEARVAWRRTKALDVLEGKCDHCGYHMNAMQPIDLRGAYPQEDR